LSGGGESGGIYHVPCNCQLLRGGENSDLRIFVSKKVPWEVGK